MDPNLNATIKNNEIVNVHTTRTSSNISNADSLNLQDLLFKYLAKWYWFVISVILCFSIAYIYLKITNPNYLVQTSILLRKDASGSGLLDMSMLELGMSGGASKEVEDEIQVLTSKTLTRKVIQELNVGTEYYVKKGLRFEEAYPLVPIKLIVPQLFNDTTKSPANFDIKHTADGYDIKFTWGIIKEKYQISDMSKSIITPIGIFRFTQILPLKVGSVYRIVSNPTKNLTEAYCSTIKVTSVNKKSNAINISTMSACPKKAEAVLDKLIELYNNEAVVDKNKIASNTAIFIDERLKLISSDLKGVETNVEDYKKSNNLIDISSEAGIYLRSAHEFDNKLFELETQFSLVGYIESYIKDNKHLYDLVPANLGITDASLIAIMQQYNTALLERMKLMRNSNDKNPVMTQLEQQIKELRGGIIASIASIKDGMKIIKRDAIGKDSQYNSKINEVPTLEREFLEIKRQQEIKQKLYLFLLQKREENALSLASTIPTAKTLDTANTDILPASPKKMIIYLLSLILGLGFPVALIYIMDMLNNKVRDRKELKKLIRVPFLGSIPISKEDDRIVVREGKTTPIVEMFRLIRTNLQFMLGGTKSPVILVTSSVAGEGKSFTSINMAMSFALMKKKVILIGLDIRNPMLGEYMHIAKDKGITLYLSDISQNIQDIVIPSGFHPFLNVIPAGPIPPNPAELLMSPRLDELIAKLKLEYDYIIVDSAPVGIVSDTYLLNRFVDNCIYVTRQDYTPREACALINDVNKNKQINKVAVVLNGTDESLGYGHGYGYGYGANSQKSNNGSIKDKIINRIRK
jgi:capsular exopolysaccharide synthesis family protein